MINSLPVCPVVTLKPNAKLQMVEPDPLPATATATQRGTISWLFK